jgi:predicted ATPase
MTPLELKLLSEILDSMSANNKLYSVLDFRAKHNAEQNILDGLENDGLLFDSYGRYILTLHGIKACNNATSKTLFERCISLINALKNLYRRKPTSEFLVEEIAARMKPAVRGERLARILTVLSHHFSPKTFQVIHYNKATSLVSSIRISEPILDLNIGDVDSLPRNVKVKNNPVVEDLRSGKYFLREMFLNGFKSIRTLRELKFKEINVLIGANGAGKSNFISFFRFLGAIFQSPGELQLYTADAGGADALLFDRSKTTPRIEAELSFSSEQTTYEYHCTLSTTRADTFIFVEERYRVSQGGQGTWERGADVGGKESGVYDAFVQGTPTAGTISGLMREFAIYQFHDTSETARIRKNFSATDNKRLKSDGANLAAFLLRIKTENLKVYERITGAVRLIAPFFADFVLEPSPSQNILLQWRERGSDVVFSAHQASDGTLRMMALVALLLQPQEELPAFIIIDEPELGLHPYAIKVIAGLIKSASESVQLIIATQSTALLNQFEPEDVIVVDRINRETTFKRLNPEDLAGWLEDYSLSELWEKNVLGGRPSR